MGKPARDRQIIKIFDEMRLNQRGIKISDIPEALDRLGIDINSELKRKLVKAKLKAQATAQPYDLKRFVQYRLTKLNVLIY